MQILRRNILILSISLAVAVIATLFALRSQGQNNQSAGSASVMQERDDESYGPLVDYSGPEPANPQERAKRQNKSRRYNGRHLKEDYRVEDSTLISEGGRIPAIPLAFSHVVLIGEVTDAQAYMAEDKKGVYSEFTILVDEVLRGESQSSLAHGDTVVTEREGGRVRFESGHIVRYSVDRQSMPRKGRRYVLFLRRNDQAENLYIVTGYELRAGKVLPLDGVNVPQGASKLPQFATYENADEPELLDAVREAIAAPADWTLTTKSRREQTSTATSSGTGPKSGTPKGRRPGAGPGTCSSSPVSR